MTNPPKALPREFYEEPHASHEARRRSRRLTDPDGFFRPFHPDAAALVSGKIHLALLYGDRAFFERAMLSLEEHCRSLRSSPDEVWIVEVLDITESERVTRWSGVTTLQELCEAKSLGELAEARGVDVGAKEKLVAAAKEHGCAWRK